jgi:hypothetical protein
MRWRGRAGRARPHAVLARSSSTGTASVASAAMSYSSGGANLRHGRVPFEAIKRFREKVAAGDPPLGPGVTLTDPRITDALVRMIHPVCAQRLFHRVAARWLTARSLPRRDMARTRWITSGTTKNIAP